MIKSLAIKNWKAFADKRVSFSEGITFFVGQNGVGKTTLLDAICLCITGNLQTTRFQELIRDPKLPAQIRLDLEVDGNCVSIVRKFRRDRKIASEMLLDNKKKGMSWDHLSSLVLDLLSVDEMFFNRLTFMSEGEVFRYLDDPPSSALNAKVQEIFGIANLQTLSGFSERIEKKLSSSIRDVSSELKTIKTKIPSEDSDIASVEDYLARKKAEEKRIQEEMDTLTKQIREIGEEKKYYEQLKALMAEITEEYGTAIEKTLKESFVDTLKETINSFDSEVASEEETLSKSEASVGSVQNRINYLKDIDTLLQSVITDTAMKVIVPCPVCKRPVDKALAEQLIHDTEIQIEKAKNELTEVQNSAKALREGLTELRQKIKKLREYETKIKGFPKSILENARPLSIDKVALLLSSIEESLKEKSDIEKTKTSELINVKNEIDRKTTELAELKADSKQVNRLSLLKDRLSLNYERQMLAGILTGALESTLQEQKDQRLSHVYRLLSELWQKFRPESQWQIGLDEKGLIKVVSDSRQYEFAHLSGGEKTVLLVLARVILCRLLSTKIDFLMIDEPLEHLDIRNRRSLLNFLVTACQKDFIPQMFVTSFEETLIRKYYEGEKTSIELLA